MNKNNIMQLWTLGEILKALEIEEEKYFNNNNNLLPESLVSEVSIDSRSLKNDSIFLAINGKIHDGHDYINQALENGAKFVFIEHEKFKLENPNNLKRIIKVPSTLNALKKLAIFRRRKFEGKVFGITGSIGKTTTKEMLARVCMNFGKTSYSQKSYNNYIGVLLSLSNLNKNSQFGIFEVGMNHSGEIEQLTELIKPDIAVITVITESHIGNLGSLRAIFKEKSSILNKLLPGGKLVMNLDSRFSKEMINLAKRLGFESITFGRNKYAKFQLITLDEDKIKLNSKIKFLFNNKVFYFTLPFIGFYRALGALSIIASLYSVGISDIQKICDILSEFLLPDGRGSIYRLFINSNNNITIINDCYNSSPTALKASLYDLNFITPENNGRKLAIIGDMKELGLYTPYFYKDLRRYIDKMKFINYFICCGKDIKLFYDSLPLELRGGYEELVQNILPIIDNIIKPNDIFLVKASNCLNFNLIVDYFFKKYKL